MGIASQVSSDTPLTQADIDFERRCEFEDKRGFSRSLKVIAEEDLTSLKTSDLFTLSLLRILLETHRQVGEQIRYSHCLGEVQYLLLLTRNRRKLVDIMFFGGQPDRSQIINAFTILIQQAALRNTLLSDRF